LSTVNVAVALLNLTEVAPVRLLPLICTDVPGAPLVGANDVISGVPGTVNFVELVAVPDGVVTLMNPVVVPLATVAVIWDELTTVKLVASVRLNTTSLAPVRFVPLIVTNVPGAPLVGENELIVGLPAAATMKSVALVAVPPGVVTWMGPVCVPLATVAEIFVLESTVKLSAALFPNLTAVAPVKFVPSITTSAPTGPEVGENDVIVGAPAAVTVKFWALVPVPPGVVTLIFPVVAPEGTVAVICVSVLTVNVVAAVLLNVTAVAPVKLVPVITTEVPTGPLVGLKLVTVGAPPNTVKSEELVSVPFGVVTVVGPVAAPEGTVVVIWSDEFTVNDALTLLKNFTELAPSKFDPEIVTEIPTAPPLGENDEIVGSSVAVKTKSSALVPVPSGFVTEMGPVWALPGTVAVI
jgi:hypothetical protein